METNNYIPSHPVHPFEILKDELAAQGIRQKDFAKSIGMRDSNFSRMLREMPDLTPELALSLEKELGIPFSDWMHYQERYMKDKVRIAERDAIESELAATEQTLSERLNLKELYKRAGLTHKSVKERVETVMRYSTEIFSPDKTREPALYKKSGKRMTDSKNLLTWTVLALMECDNGPKPDEYTNGKAIEAAREISAYAHNGKVSKATVMEILNRHNIGFHHVEKLEKTPVDAYSTRRDNRMFVVVTYRINDLDKFVFDVLHELGHIALHIESGIADSFINVDGEAGIRKLEDEADAFARDCLIPIAHWKKIISSSASSLNPYAVSQKIGDRAKELGYSPSIAVARYKHESQRYNLKIYQSPKLL